MLPQGTIGNYLSTDYASKASYNAETIELHKLNTNAMYSIDIIVRFGIRRKIAKVWLTKNESITIFSGDTFKSSYLKIKLQSFHKNPLL